MIPTKNTGITAAKIYAGKRADQILTLFNQWLEEQGARKLIPSDLHRAHIYFNVSQPLRMEVLDANENK